MKKGKKKNIKKGDYIMLKTVKDAIRYCNHFDRKIVIISDDDYIATNDVKGLENALFISFELVDKTLKIYL